MAIVSKDVFAKKTGQTTKTLSTYNLRGKVVYTKDGKVDEANPVNAAFMAMHPAEKKQQQVPREETFKDPSDSEDPTFDLGDIPNTFISDARYKHFLALKTERAAELDRLKIDKIKGEVIPSDLMPPVILQHNQSFINAFKIAAEQMLTDYAKIKSFTVEEIATMRAKMMEAIKDGAKNATAMSLKSVSGIVKEFSVKRGVGERA